MGHIPTTANRVIALISSMYSRAIQWGYFDGNHPCRGMDKYREKSRSRFVLPDEMPASCWPWSMKRTSWCVTS